MKKTLLLLLFTSSIATALSQYDRTATSTPTSLTETIFNTPAPGKMQINFEFLLGRGAKMVLEFSSINQVDSLPNPDSLVREVWAELQPLRNSFANPLASRRIDFLISPLDQRVRIIDYPQRGEVFRMRNNDITQLKVEQDTLRIKMFSKRFTSVIPNLPRPYFLMLVLNNITDITTLAPDELSKGLNLLKKDLTGNKKLSRNSSFYTRYYALYNVPNLKKMSPFKNDIIAIGKKREFIPYIPVGIQYIRSAWVPSTGVGGELKKMNGNATQYIRLYWEPLFYFGRDANNKLTTDMNSFVSFKFTNTTKAPNSNELIFASNFSVGYLLHRQGNLFEKHTVKFGLPGAQMKNVLLEPEFVFNGLFKNFSPSLKLSLYFE